jgi:hypothetical protein
MLSTINTKKVKVAVKGLLKICRTQAHVAAAALRCERLSVAIEATPHAGAMRRFALALPVEPFMPRTRVGPLSIVHANRLHNQIRCPETLLGGPCWR